MSPQSTSVDKREAVIMYVGQVPWEHNSPPHPMQFSWGHFWNQLMYPSEAH